MAKCYKMSKHDKNDKNDNDEDNNIKNTNSNDLLNLVFMSNVIKENHIYKIIVYTYLKKIIDIITSKFSNSFEIFFNKTIIKRLNDIINRFIVEDKVIVLEVNLEDSGDFNKKLKTYINNNKKDLTQFVFNIKTNSEYDILPSYRNINITLDDDNVKLRFDNKILLITSDNQLSITNFLSKISEVESDSKDSKKDFQDSKDSKDPRYQYMFLRNEGCSGSTYRRYLLSNDNTFNNIFFNDKKTFLKNFNTFKNKEGPYSKGIKHRLGILLYGPPGTGKTSFIKALAYETSRSIININLKNIRTNAELFTLLYSESIYEKDNCNVRYKHSQVIYVFEDIDCQDAVILRKNEKKDKDKNDKGNDSLNLSGILNAIDGSIDCQNRIIIMTSNHIEYLDPAVIRPGRINYRINMDTLDNDTIIEMLDYYNIFSSEELEKLKNYPDNFNLKGSVVENFIIQHFYDVQKFEAFLKIVEENKKDENNVFKNNYELIEEDINNLFDNV